jgi:DNA-binding GntR family transcriptional regulator
MAGARVRDLLEEAILEGSLKPGERLRAEALARRFGTSRTPIREALLQLEADGLVDVEPNRGAVVRPFDREDLLDLYRVRALLEPAAAALAARRIAVAQVDALETLCDVAETAPVEDQIAYNEQFHRIVGEAAGSPRLSVAMRAVAGIPRTFRARFWHSDAQRAESLLCHRRIVTAMRTRDAELAEAVMRMHILGAVAFLEETWPSH